MSRLCPHRPSAPAAAALAVALTLAAGLTPAAAQDDPAKAADLAAQAIAESQTFRPLFNHKDLAGWKPVNAKGNFVVSQEGLLVMNKGTGWLATEKPYGDFELHVVYRFVTPGADSGIFIRSGLDGPTWTNRGYQVQNMDNETLGKVISMGRPVTESLHALDEVKKAKKPAGGWNDLLIIANGPQVGVTLNGVPVASATIEPGTGHIGLQAEGGVLEFRTIEIRNLSAPLPEAKPPAQP